MRWRIPLVVLVFPFLAVACDGNIPASPDAAELASPEISLAVKIFETNRLIPVAFSSINPCTGVEVRFEGWDHYVSKHWDNGYAKVHFQYNLTGVDGNGLRYRYTETYNEQRKLDFSPWVLEINGRIVSQTGEDNWIKKTHITINANGDFTIERHADRCVG